MLKIDDNLLQTIGLGALPTEDKRGLLTHIYETLEMRVGMRLADQMTNEQLDEFETYFEAKDDAGAFKWLEANFPNYKDIVNEEFEKLKSEVQQSAPQILAAAQQNAAANPQLTPEQPALTQPQIAPAAQPDFQPQAAAWPSEPIMTPPAAPQADLYARQSQQLPEPSAPTQQAMPQPYQPAAASPEPQAWVPTTPAEPAAIAQPFNPALPPADWQPSTPAAQPWQPAAPASQAPRPDAIPLPPQTQFSPMEQPQTPPPDQSSQQPPAQTQQFQPMPPAWTPDQPSQSN